VLISFIRAAILYLVLILVIRLMGKRQLGEMEPTEFVISMLIANLAAVPMQETGIPLLAGLIPILVVLAIELLLSVWVFNDVGARRFFCGKPVILVENGKLVQSGLRHSRVNVDELTEYLRLQGVVDISTVKYAILETGGSISVLPYPKDAPASAMDAGVRVDELRLPVTLVMNGRLMKDNLPIAGKSAAWVEEQLKKYNCRVADVFFFTAEPGGKLFLSIREGGAA
jgi:uncharacterized membrane protein YcaP (DUF421 family)